MTTGFLFFYNIFNIFSIIPDFSTYSGLSSYIFATVITAVFYTYGSKSSIASFNGYIKYSFKSLTLRQPIVLNAIALTTGFLLSLASLTNELTTIIASYGNSYEYYVIYKYTSFLIS